MAFSSWSGPPPPEGYAWGLRTRKAIPIRQASEIVTLSVAGLSSRVLRALRNDLKRVAFHELKARRYKSAAAAHKAIADIDNAIVTRKL